MPFSDFLELMSEIMMQTTRWGNLSTKLNGYVGFDTIQEQIKKKSLKRGFELNLMVVGKDMIVGVAGTGMGVVLSGMGVVLSSHIHAVDSVGSNFC